MGKPTPEEVGFKKRFAYKTVQDAETVAKDLISESGGTLSVQERRA